MAMATALLAPWAIRDLRRGALPLNGRRTSILAVSGLLLAGHFLFWTASLHFTSIAASVLLVSLHPLIVAPLARRLLGDRLPARAAAGMTLAVIGTVITCVADFRLNGTALIG